METPKGLNLEIESQSAAVALSQWVHGIAQNLEFEIRKSLLEQMSIVLDDCDPDLLNHLPSDWRDLVIQGYEIYQKNNYALMAYFFASKLEKNREKPEIIFYKE